MRSITLRKKVSFLSFALGSLMVTSLGTTKVEALPVFSCALQCNLSSVTKSAAGRGVLLNRCAKKCDNKKIMDALLANNNYQALDETNKEKFLDALAEMKAVKEHELDSKNKESKVTESRLNQEEGKPKRSNSKIKNIQKNLESLKSDARKLENEIRTLEASIKGLTKGTKAPTTIGAPEPMDMSKSGLSEAGQAFFKRNYPILTEAGLCSPYISPDFKLSAADEAVRIQFCKDKGLPYRKNYVRPSQEEIKAETETKSLEKIKPSKRAESLLGAKHHRTRKETQETGKELSKEEPKQETVVNPEQSPEQTPEEVAKGRSRILTGRPSPVFSPREKGRGVLPRSGRVAPSERGIVKNQPRTETPEEETYSEAELEEAIKKTHAELEALTGSKEETEAGTSESSGIPVVTYPETSVPPQKESQTSGSKSLLDDPSSIKTKMRQRYEEMKARKEGAIDPELAEKLEKRRTLEGH